MVTLDAAKIQILIYFEDFHFIIRHTLKSGNIFFEQMVHLKVRICLEKLVFIPPEQQNDNISDCNF